MNMVCRGLGVAREPLAPGRLRALRVAAFWELAKASVARAARRPGRSPLAIAHDAWVMTRSAPREMRFAIDRMDFEAMAVEALQRGAA